MSGERHRNKTRERIPVHQLFEEQAAKTPDSVAVLQHDKAVTYRELNCRANRLAHHLRSLGVEPYSRVALCIGRSPDMVVALLGILKAGAAYVPLDPTHPAERLSFILEDAGPRVLVTATDIGDQLPQTEAASIFVDRLDGGHDDDLPATAGPDDLAYVTYTSGSTGQPKGVQIEHRSLTNFLQSMLEEPGLSASDRMLAVTTLSFDIAALEIYLPLIVGASVVLAQTDEASNGQKLLQLLTRSQPAVMQGTPATWRMLIAAGWPGSPGLDILCGGEGLPHTLAAELAQRGKSVWNLYGPTETTVYSTLFRYLPGSPAHEHLVPIGRPIANTRVQVLDESLKPVPVGTAGELFIGGMGVARGYLDRPELTAEKFLTDSQATEASGRMFRTGDRVVLAEDGELRFLGRLDHQVKIRGFRVEPGEVEAALVEHPRIQQTVVSTTEDASGHSQLVAYVVLQENSALTVEDLKKFLTERLPSTWCPADLSHWTLSPSHPLARPTAQPFHTGPGADPCSEPHSCHPRAPPRRKWPRSPGVSLAWTALELTTTSLTWGTTPCFSPSWSLASASDQGWRFHSRESLTPPRSRGWPESSRIHLSCPKCQTLTFGVSLGTATSLSPTPRNECGSCSSSTRAVTRISSSPWFASKAHWILLFWS